MKKTLKVKKEQKWTAESIRGLRIKYRLTQKEMSAVLGTRQQTISEWELGVYEPKNAYAKVLDLVAAELQRIFRDYSKEERYKFLSETYPRFT